MMSTATDAPSNSNSDALIGDYDYHDVHSTCGYYGSIAIGWFDTIVNYTLVVANAGMMHYLFGRFSSTSGECEGMPSLRASRLCFVFGKLTDSP